MCVPQHGHTSAEETLLLLCLRQRGDSQQASFSVSSGQLLHSLESLLKSFSVRSGQLLHSPWESSQALTVTCAAQKKEPLPGRSPCLWRSSSLGEPLTGGKPLTRGAPAWEEPLSGRNLQLSSPLVDLAPTEFCLMKGRVRIGTASLSEERPQLFPSGSLEMRGGPGGKTQLRKVPLWIKVWEPFPIKKEHGNPRKRVIWDSAVGLFKFPWLEDRSNTQTRGKTCLKAKEGNYTWGSGTHSI